MFDIGFFEIAIVAVVALFVVGPERLPGLVRTVGFWFGKVRYWVNSTNMEMKREWHNAEILRQEAELKAKGALEQITTVEDKGSATQPQPLAPAEKLVGVEPSSVAKVTEPGRDKP